VHHNIPMNMKQNNFPNWLYRIINENVTNYLILYHYILMLSFYLPHVITVFIVCGIIIKTHSIKTLSFKSIYKKKEKENIPNHVSMLFNEC
jgi:hypothetical protein